MYCGCTCAAAPMCRGAALGLLEQSDVAKSATFRTGEAVGYLISNDNGYILSAGKATE